MKRLLLTGLAALMLLPASAVAKDSNDDNLPDRWEREHGLSLHVDQARRDQDDDSVRNKAEYKHGTNPRDDDSDDDGTEDGDEAGRIKSFDTATGNLVITLLNGDDVSGTVTDDTEIECGASDDASDGSTSGNSGPGGGSDDDDDGSGQHGDDDNGDDDNGDDDSGDDDNGDDDSGHHGDDDDSDDDRDCGTEALIAGARVHEAELKLSSGAGAVWREIELVG